MSYKDALAAVEELLYDTLGFPELEVAEAYSMDLKTMLEHYELYKKAGGKEEIAFTKDDECYVFFFRQVIDEIPIINIYWAKATFGENETTPVTYVTVFYTRDGIREIYAIDLLDIVEGGENKPLISPAKALQVVIDDYSEIIPQLVSVFIGVLIFCFNIVIGKMSGLVASGTFIFMSYFSIYAGTLNFGPKIYYFSPYSWASMNYLNWKYTGEIPSPTYAVFCLLGAILFMSIVSVIVFCKKDINIQEWGA